MISAKTLLSVIALVLLAACPPASGEDVIIAAPSYSAVNNITGRPITVDSYGWLHGIDYEGEWLEYTFELTSFGVHSSGILVKGTLGAEFHLHMVITGTDSHFLQSLDFNFTGSGFVG
jgi:hypothetical protein